ncbi:MAG: aquaporin [Planctomycetes bacterium]|nr:aquaporin [Planctomycetota bacterium]MCW8135877.1 aquaporin [Planctomycetota bacterium]
MARKAIAEAMGTFAMVFAGTGAIVINHVSEGAITHVGIALTFGLVVMAVIYALGEVSGAHINPAVTLAFWAAGRFKAREIAPYLAAQLVGALAASALLLVMFGNVKSLGATLPAGAPWQSFALEVVLTWFLMFVILGVSTGARETGIMAGAAIGGVVALEAMFAGPISGASMNPARSLAPALVSGHLEHVWVYLLAPVVGALLAVPSAAIVRLRKPKPAPGRTSTEDAL